MASVKPIIKSWVKKINHRLSPSQRHKLKNILPTRFVSFTQRLLSEKKTDEQKYIIQLRRKLLNLGFTDRPLAELWELTNTPNSTLRRLAARELALWYANLRTVEGAKKCLQLLEIKKAEEHDPVNNRQSAILEIESYQLLGDTRKAKQIAEDTLAEESHPDLLFSAANLEPSIDARVAWINKALEQYQLMPIKVDSDKSKPFYDCIVSDVTYKRDMTLQGPKVTVIIPVYNAADVIHTAMDSVLSQTWTNLEIIVVDDCSTDETGQIIETYMKADERIQFIKTEKNGGAYVARNYGLKVATGEFVTCHDADDWSHPEKIEKQVTHLIKHPAIMGNTSQQARATSDLLFYRRGNFSLTLANISSFMFRRKPVFEKIGYLDSVRFAADSEYIRRVKTVFGLDSVVDLDTGPLSFQRQTSESLTGNESFGFHGFFMGARQDYFDNQVEFHKTANNLKYDFPQRSRPFPVAEPMKPDRNKENRHFDVIIVSDFRMSGGSTYSNAEEIKCQTQYNMRTGLIQMSRYDLHAHNKIRPEIRSLIDGDQVQMIVYGEKVSCDLLILRYPPILQEWQRYIPEVEAKEVRIIINQPPMSDYSEAGVRRYELKTAQEHVVKYFGQKGIWHPIGPLVREALHEHHKEDLGYITLSDEDWVNIIDVDYWKRSARPNNKKIRIGRHSRDHASKWPESKNDLMMVYPTDKKYEIHVLGGAGTPRRTLGSLPNNWIVADYDEIHPKDFLAGLDVFVYYTHSEWIESFGRVIIEAMAVGVPVILPHSYKVLFGEAAIYADVEEVGEKVFKLMYDPHVYKIQVEKAFEFVEKHFSYCKHFDRVGVLLTV